MMLYLSLQTHVSFISTQFSPLHTFHVIYYVLLFVYYLTVSYCFITIKGVMEYANGDVYSGDWHKGAWYSQGKLIRLNGSVLEGYWSFIERKVALTALPGKKQAVWELMSGSYHRQLEKVEKIVCLNGDEILI
jgi:hypothetical protein